MIIKKLTITPIGFQYQSEIYQNICPNKAGELIKSRLYNANGYDTKIPRCVLIKSIGKKLQKIFDINPECLVLNQKFVYNA